jgi:rod shape-determining protein MreB
MKLFDSFVQKFSLDIGIDLGTANTLVYVRGQGIVVTEPSVVALNKKTGSLVAVGSAAEEMYGRTPGHIEAIRPLVDGVISDFEVTEEMLRYLIRKAHKNSGTTILFGPRVVVGVPSGVTNVEVRAVIDAAKAAGAREVYIVEEPMAAAIGMDLPIRNSIGTMVIDIGGGTADIAVISLSGVVISRSVKIAGDTFNRDIIQYARDRFQLLIGERTAEYAKIALADAIPSEKVDSPIRGRDLATGLPREIMISSEQVADAMAESLATLLEGIREVIEKTPPEILSDVMQRGIYLTGGGALIKNIDTLISIETKMPVHIAPEPLTSVAKGAGIILEDLDTYKEVLVNEHDYVIPFA